MLTSRGAALPDPRVHDGNKIQKAHILPELKWICEGQWPRPASVHLPWQRRGMSEGLASTSIWSRQREAVTMGWIPVAASLSSHCKVLGWTSLKSKFNDVLDEDFHCDCSGFPLKSLHPRPSCLFIGFNDFLPPATELHQDIDFSRCLVALKKEVMSILLWHFSFSNLSKRLSATGL